MEGTGGGGGGSSQENLGHNAHRPIFSIEKHIFTFLELAPPEHGKTTNKK